MPREWDAATYDRIPMPHLRWGTWAIARLHLIGNERVLDAGCGTGRVTQALLERLPLGKIVTLDASSAMLEQLHTRLARELNRIEVVRADLMQPLPPMSPVDAVLSTATLHWLPDHRMVFHHLAAVMRPGAQLVVDCGGAGNVARIEAIVRDLGHAVNVWNFTRPEETRRHLEAAGFHDIDVWLEPDPARLEAGGQLETYLATVVLGAHLDLLPENERHPFVRAVASRMDEPIVDYVRLNIVARRS